MNRIKSKENLDPNTFGIIKQEINHNGKTKIQAHIFIQQNLNNPEKVPHQKNHKKKPAVKNIKNLKKSQFVQATLHYEEQITSYVMNQAVQTFDSFKQLKQNKEFKNLRQNLIQPMYKQSKRLQLKRKTFHLYVHYLDTYIKSLGSGSLSKAEQYSLASYSSFFMAQKYQEIYPPSIEQWLPLPSYHIPRVYKQEGKILFQLNFKLIYQSLESFFQYWAMKYQLTEKQIKNCNYVIDSIVFNYDLLYKYEPQKIAKALAMMEAKESKKSIQIQDMQDPFNSTYERNKVKQDIAKHIFKYKQKIDWIQSLH